MVLTYRLCDEEITFDEDHVSERTGKKIPLDIDTREPHDCEVWKEQRQQEKLEEWKRENRRYYPCKKET